MPLGFQLISKSGEPTILAEVDNMIATELYHITPNPKQWSRKDGYDWYQHIGWEIASSELYNDCSWFKILKIILYKNRNSYEGKTYTKEIWEDNKLFIKEYVVPVIKFLHSKGLQPRCCGYVTKY